MPDDDDEVYMRRVRNPSPLLTLLASDVVDLLEKLPKEFRTPKAVAEHAAAYNVPYGYIIDELERRVRERRGRATRTPEKGAASE